MENRDKGIGRVNYNKTFLFNHQKRELSELKEARASRDLACKSSRHSGPTESPGQRQGARARKLEYVIHFEVCSIHKTLRCVVVVEDYWTTMVDFSCSFVILDPLPLHQLFSPERSWAPQHETFFSKVGLMLWLLSTILRPHSLAGYGDGAMNGPTKSTLHSSQICGQQLPY